MSQLLLNLNIPDRSKEDFEAIEPSLCKKSIRTSNRSQVEFRIGSVDELIPNDHRARDVWEYVCSLDLGAFHKKIKVVDGCGGPKTVDPKVLLSLWLYAILEGIISARRIADLCKMHYAYIWICGGVSINYHTLSDFRTQQSDHFNSLLQESIALMWKTGKFNPEIVAQDGTRIKADAGSSSARREPTIERYLIEANLYLKALTEEHAKNPGALSLREKAAQKKAAKERKERIEQAQIQMKQYKKSRIESGIKNHNKLSEKEIAETRVSITDPECRKMKMGDGGFRLAYNVQFATSTDQKVILGVDVINSGDQGTLGKMMQQVNDNLTAIGCRTPKKWLADAAYANKADAEDAETNFSDITFYSTPTSNGKVDALTPRTTDNEAMINLRKRMSEEESTIIYKERAETAEFANAVAKNRGMGKLLVRGLSKALNMALLYALAHNMTIYFRAA
jgi:transposase